MLTNSIQYMKMLLPLQGAIDEYKTPRVSAHIVRLALGCVLLALQAANRDGYKTPRVSAHMVRLVLGCALLAFQAVPFLCLFRFLLTMHFWLFWPLYSSPLILCSLFISERPERAASLSPGQATTGSDTLGIMYTHPPGALKGQKH